MGFLPNGKFPPCWINPQPVSPGRIFHPHFAAASPPGRITSDVTRPSTSVDVFHVFRAASSSCLLLHGDRFLHDFLGQGLRFQGFSRCEAENIGKNHLKNREVKAHAFIWSTTSCSEPDTINSSTKIQPEDSIDLQIEFKMFFQHLHILLPPHITLSASTFGSPRCASLNLSHHCWDVAVVSLNTRAVSLGHASSSCVATRCCKASKLLFIRSLSCRLRPQFEDVWRLNRFFCGILHETTKEDSKPSPFEFWFDDFFLLLQMVTYRKISNAFHRTLGYLLLRYRMAPTSPTSLSTPSQWDSSIIFFAINLVVLPLFVGTIPGSTTSLNLQQEEKLDLQPISLGASSSCDSNFACKVAPCASTRWEAAWTKNGWVAVAKNRWKPWWFAKGVSWVFQGVSIFFCFPSTF